MTLVIIDNVHVGGDRNFIRSSISRRLHNCVLHPNINAQWRMAPQLASPSHHKSIRISVQLIVSSPVLDDSTRNAGNRTPKRSEEVLDCLVGSITGQRAGASRRVSPLTYLPDRRTGQPANGGEIPYPTFLDEGEPRGQKAVGPHGGSNGECGLWWFW